MTIVTATRGTTGFDGKSMRPLRFGVMSEEGLWTNGVGECVRIRAVDLRALMCKAAAVREEHPHAVVVVDIDVVIARDAPTARAVMTESGYASGDTMVYVGTPLGLSGLVADIHALGIADGAVLLPVDGDGGVLDLIRDVVLPELQSISAA